MNTVRGSGHKNHWFTGFKCSHLKRTKISIFQGISSSLIKQGNIIGQLKIKTGWKFKLVKTWSPSPKFGHFQIEKTLWRKDASIQLKFVLCSKNNENICQKNNTSNNEL